MGSHPLPLLLSPHLNTTLLAFFVLYLIVVPSFSSPEAEDETNYKICSERYDCGLLQNLSYPFWGGNDRPRVYGHQGFELKCQESQQPVLVSDVPELIVLNISQASKRMTLARLDFWEFGLCPQVLVNTSLNETLFRSNPDENTPLNLVYNCTSVPPNLILKTVLQCPPRRDGFVYEGINDALRQEALEENDCEAIVEVPVPRRDLDLGPGGSLKVEDVQKLVKRGFNVSYEHERDFSVCDKCVRSGGVCGTNISSSAFACLCRNKSYPDICPDGETDDVGRKVGIGVASLTGAVIVACFFIYCINCNAPSDASSKLSVPPTRKNRDNDRVIEEFIREHGPLTLQIYNYSDIKRMSNNFEDKLGQGGYGSVYKGKQADGRPVAVKVLSTSTKSGEEFIKKVASLSRTSHVNVVTLLGFCLEGGQRALVYEFMPNGSLEKYINNENKLKVNDEHLGWEKLHQIAIGVARGLEYLHRGCNTRIVHFDIKPHNILLDHQFCPKISDFGLAKLCTRKDDIISMSMARGTIGYIAPEVFSRQFGGVSHKSDVYSYGMLVLEMVGARKRDEAQTENSSEKYFPEWIYRRLEAGLEFELQEETEIVRKMTIVGLWCIQTNPGQRPSISTVIEMLEGPVEALAIPPKPVLSSPVARSPPSYSSSTTLLT